METSQWNLLSNGLRFLIETHVNTRARSSGTFDVVAVIARRIRNRIPKELPPCFT